MFCNYCGVQFEHEGWQPWYLCRECAKRKDMPYGKRSKKRFCCHCRTEFLTSWRPNIKNECIEYASLSKECWRCREIEHMKMCLSSRPLSSEEFRQRIRESHKPAQDEALRKAKTEVSKLARTSNEPIEIIYECSCPIPSEQKHWHHYDYSKPFSVIALCPFCHMHYHSHARGMNAPAYKNRQVVYVLPDSKLIELQSRSQDRTG